MKRSSSELEGGEGGVHASDGLYPKLGSPVAWSTDGDVGVAGETGVEGSSNIRRLQYFFLVSWSIMRGGGEVRSAGQSVSLRGVGVRSDDDR
jgi:hypothetical protein